MNPVKLVVCGPVYTADVFVRTSVAHRRLDADLILRNTTGQPAEVEVLCDAVDDKTGRVARTFGPVRVSVPAHGEATVALGGPWQDPKLWWPEPEPNLYVLRTRVERDGQVLDVHEQLFGFREVSIRGKDFLLNGIPWHFWNWVDVGRASDPDDWLRRYHAQKDRFHRIASDHDRLWRTREEALEFFDRHGVPGRLSTCIDGMFITHNLQNPLVWENFAEHVRQVVRAYRNHPSVMMWSLGNELLFITSRLAYDAQDNLRWMAKAYELCQAARELDPTRPSFFDGGGDLNRRGEVNCQHYSLPKGPAVPAECYSYRLREGQWEPTGRWDRSTEQYAWDGKRPLVLGEVFYYSGNPSAMAWIGGPDVYRGKAFADLAAARYARILIEGARWQGVTAICPWVEALPEALVSFEPRAVFVREYNSCFYPGSTARRTVKVFNDTHFDEPLQLRWRAVLDGQAVASGQKTYTVPPGRAQQDVLEVPLPDSKQRLDGRLELELYAGSKRVFSDSKPLNVLPPGGPVEGLTERTFAVFDPGGRVVDYLRGIGQAFTAVEDLDSVPEGVQVLLIGPDAIDQQNRAAVAGGLRRLVEAGGTAIVLEQSVPLEGDDLPVAGIQIAGERPDRPPRPEFRAAGGRSGRIAFPVAPAHPVLEGMRSEDFFTWAPDERTFRLSYATPSTGAIALVQGGNELSLTPMMELPVGQGSYLLLQMLIGAKLGVEPVAERLLHNMLRWAAGRVGRQPGRTVVFLGGDEALHKMLDAIHLSYSTADSPLGALADSPEVAVVRATSGALAELADHADRVRAYCQGGGNLMLVGLEPDGLEAFNRLVGFRHRIRPFQREAVSLLARSDPLLLGLSDRDVSMKSDQMLAAWRHLYWVSDRTFSYVVDGRDIASFARFDNPELFKVANGLTNDDFWRYIHYFNADGDQVVFRYDRPETFTHMSIWSNESYYFIKDIELVFDGDESSALCFTLKPTKERQELDFEPRTASTLTLRILNHWPDQSSQNLVGIDNVVLLRQVPEDFDRRVVLLTKPGGLVRYPVGKGNIVLNQVDYTRPDTAENVSKKRSIYANLLRNLGAALGR